MNFPATLFAAEWLWLSWLILAGVLAYCVRMVLREDGRWLCDTRHTHAFLGALVCLAVMWGLKAGVKPGLNLHLIGATLLTLMADAPLAILGLLVVLAGVTLNGQADWQSYALNGLVMCVLPVVSSRVLMHWIERRLPAHFFVYIFVGAFFNAALSILILGAVTNGLMLASGTYTLDLLMEEYTLFFLLLAFSEAWLTGIVITGMVVYRPHWVVSFQDSLYLSNK